MVEARPKVMNRFSAKGPSQDPALRFPQELPDSLVGPPGTSLFLPGGPFCDFAVDFASYGLCLFLPTHTPTNPMQKALHALASSSRPTFSIAACI